MGTAATKAKSKYNIENYDTITVRAPRGANEAITELARLSGRTKADYIRSVISSHARSLERHDLAKKVGGGGAMIAVDVATDPLAATECVTEFLAWANRRSLAPAAELEARLRHLIEHLK